MEIADLSAERVARNDATFREANEAIRGRAAHLEAELERVPFICECADLRCTEIVRLTLVEYEAVRADGRHFLMAHGHADGGAEREHTRVVEELPSHVVAEKVGRAAEIAEDLDPRGVGSQ